MLWSNNILRIQRLLCVMVLPFLLAACGYGMSSKDDTILGTSKTTLKLTSVEQPTMFPWVGYTLRATLRDEIAARNLAVWVDNGKADYNMHLRVNSFTMRSSVKNTQDATELYTGTVDMTAIFFNGANNVEEWRTNVSYSNTFETDNEETAATLLFTQAVRRIADNMRSTF